MAAHSYLPPHRREAEQIMTVIKEESLIPFDGNISLSLGELGVIDTSEDMMKTISKHLGRIEDFGYSRYLKAGSLYRISSNETPTA